MFRRGSDQDDMSNRRHHVKAKSKLTVPEAPKFSIRGTKNNLNLLEEVSKRAMSRSPNLN